MPKVSAAMSLLAQAPMFRDLPRAQQRALAVEMREMAYEPEQTIFSRGDPGLDAHIVAEGRVRLSVLNSEGRVLSFNNASAGDLFGEIAAFDGGPRTADATAMTHVRTFALARASLIDMLTTRPETALAAITFLCGRVRATSAQVEDIALHSITVRIARFVLSALRLSKTPHAGTRTATLDLRMSQGELADLLGASRQKTNLALSNLKNEGAISRRKGIYTCNLAQLRRIARTD